MVNKLSKKFNSLSEKHINTLFFLLLISNAMLATIFPIIAEHRMGIYVFQIALFLTQGLSVLITKTHDKLFFWMVFLALTSMAANWLNFLLDRQHWTMILQFSFSFPFSVLLTYQVTRFVTVTPRINPGTIYASVVGYLMVGVTGAWLNYIIIYFDPAAISLPQASGYLFDDMLYYSYISLSTVGYGDITPVSGAARSVAMTLAIVGQFYLAIIIAMLVGKYISGNART